MTVGEKILKLRSAAGISQEELAEKLGVSRQSVSKWEMNQALPQVDKITAVAKLFSVTTDELLDEGVETLSGIGKRERNKYFGTDGFRGEANVGLTSMQAYRVGRFLGWYYSSHLYGGARGAHRPRIVIGKDTRRSSYMLEYSIVAGITASGADAYMLHVITTPGVSYVTRQDSFDCGIMITASHNPYYDNGIKIINSYGEKLDDETTALIEAYIDGDLAALGVGADDIPLAERSRIGCIYDYASGRNRYIGYLISLVSNSFKKLRIGLDCANGASWNIANAVFSALGAKTYVISNEPDGLNINDNCGSTNTDKLKKLVVENHLDLGFAFDGDADRCIAIDERGNTVDGDAIIYILAKRMKMRGTLNGGSVVCTVMSNSGFVKSLEEIGINCVKTQVGDRFVYECMQKHDYSLGGEQSGHIIMKKYATTGDGILTALMLCEQILDSKSSLLSLCEPIKIYPQYLENVRVKNKDAVLADSEVLLVKDEVEKEINGCGRVLLRKSGTEPLVRVMVESQSEEKCKEYAKRIVKAIAKGGHIIE